MYNLARGALQQIKLFATAKHNRGQRNLPPGKKTGFQDNSFYENRAHTLLKQHLRQQQKQNHKPLSSRSTGRH